MELDPPTWRLKATCPVCEQGPALVLRACPSCAAVVAICEEEGSGFPDLDDLELAVDPDVAPCPRCGRTPLSRFPEARAEQILAAGVQPSDYQ